MKIHKAVITSAARSQRRMPLQTLVDRDGTTKSALQIILQEAIASGIDEVCVVVVPGDQAAYTEAAGSYGRMLNFVEQREPKGYGHALHCAKGFTGNDAFLHLVSDHLYLSRSDKTCAQQLVEMAQVENCAVSAVQATRESMLPYYGTIGGRRLAGSRDRYEVDNVVEKPTPTEAEQRLIVPGLRAGHYLCFFGMHVLTPTVMTLLGNLVNKVDGKPVQLSTALAMLPGKERYLAVELAGSRHNIGVKYGLLMAQLALGLDGADRDEILTNLVELMAVKSRA